MEILSNSTIADHSDNYSQGFIIGTVFCLSLTAVLGFVGNGLLVIIITKARKLRSVMNRFILHLAIGDLIVCIICIPLFLAINFYFQNNNHVWICKLARFLQYLAPQGSMMLLITIGINRHQAIVHPLHSMTYSRANKLIIGAWLYSVIVVSPSLYLTKVQYHVHHSTNVTQPYCATIPVSTRLGLMYVLALSVLGYFIPLTTLVVLYSKISYAVWRRDNTKDTDLRTSRPPEAMLKSRKKVIKMFLTVIVVFVVTWLPLIIYVGMLERYLYSTTQRISRVRLILYAIGLSNSICNPFIYSFFNRRFREGCKGIFKISIRFFKKPVQRREAMKDQCLKEKSPDRTKNAIIFGSNVNQRHSQNPDWQDGYRAEAVRDYNIENAVETKDDVKLIKLKFKPSGNVDDQSLEWTRNAGFNRTTKDNNTEENRDPNDAETHIKNESTDLNIADLSLMETLQEQFRPRGRSKHNNKKLFKTLSERPSTFQKRSDAKSVKPKLRKVESAFPSTDFEWTDDYDSIF